MMKEELIKKRKQLQDRLDSIAEDYKRGLSTDSEERAQELENRETLQEIERVTREEITKIDEKLNNLG